MFKTVLLQRSLYAAAALLHALGEVALSCGVVLLHSLHPLQLSMQTSHVRRAHVRCTQQLYNMHIIINVKDTYNKINHLLELTLSMASHLASSVVQLVLGGLQLSGDELLLSESLSGLLQILVGLLQLLALVLQVLIALFQLLSIVCEQLHHLD